MAEFFTTIFFLRISYKNKFDLSTRLIFIIKILNTFKGALTTSLSCRWFLGQGEKKEIHCAAPINETSTTTDLKYISDGNSNATTESGIHVEFTSVETVNFTEEPEFWPYAINSFFHVLFGGLLAIAACFKIDAGKNESGSSRPEKTISEIWLFGNDFQNTIEIIYSNSSRGRQELFDQYTVCV